MDIPRQFADLNARVFLKVNQNVDQDASAIAAGFCQVQDQILRAFADLANIRPAGQIDPLPFPCDQNPTLVQVLFEGDDLLQRRLSADGDNNHQYLSIVRVVFQATEVLRHGNNYERHQVIRIQQPPPQNPLPPAPPQQQPPQQQQQQQQPPHAHFAPQQQQPPQPPQQQQQQQSQQVPFAPVVASLLSRPSPSSSPSSSYPVAPLPIAPSPLPLPLWSPLSH
jgi:hypothetical protein